MRSTYRGPSPEAARRLPEITTVVFRIARDEVQESSGSLLLEAEKVKVLVFLLPDEACVSVRFLCLSVWCIVCCGDICLLRIVFLRVLWVGVWEMEVSEGGFDKMIFYIKAMDSFCRLMLLLFGSIFTIIN